MNWSNVILALGVVLTGCSASNLARDVTRSAVDEGAKQLASEDTQQDMKEAAQDPKVQQATQNLTTQVAEGILQAFESPRAQQHVSQLTRSMMQAAAQQMIAALSGEKTRAQIELIARGATDAALKQAAETMRTDVGPSMRSMLEHDLAEGLAVAMGSDSMQRAVAKESQTLAHNTVLGLNSGMTEAVTAPTGALHEAPALARTVLIASAAMLGLLTLIALSFAVMLVARARQARSEVARLETATLLLATAMREKQETQQTDEILAVVQHALEGRAERTGKHRILDAIRMRKAG